MANFFQDKQQEERNAGGDFPVIPTHSHTGVDSSQVDFNNLDGVRDTRVTYNPGELSSGSSEIINFTVMGARFGDFVMTSAPYDLQGINVNSYVQAADRVTINLYNSRPVGSAAVDLASGTWKLKIISG